MIKHDTMNYYIPIPIRCRILSIRNFSLALLLVCRKSVVFQKNYKQNFSNKVFATQLIDNVAKKKQHINILNYIISVVYMCLFYDSFVGFISLIYYFFEFLINIRSSKYYDNFFLLL
jgi:purine-cytosine permease-like protein